MKGSEKRLISLYDGSNVRMIIPVYQRNYDWTRDNCRQLFDDLVSLIKNNRQNHFFGSVVEMGTQEGIGEVSIIDGQQRITTVYLLMLALVKLLEEEKITSADPQLARRIRVSYLEDEFQPEDKKLRLKPVKNDEMALKRLFKDEKDYLLSSNLTNNFRYFYERILDQELTADELFKAIQKLMIIDISLKQGEDDAQLIFESLNSTGLDLTEADKVRNYVLMNQPVKVQESLYENYWNKIEVNTNYEVSNFLRNYLTFNLKRVPKIQKVYLEFKKYSEKNDSDIEELLSDLERYSEINRDISNASTGEREVDEVLHRLNILDMRVIEPFLLPLINYWKLNKIDFKALIGSLKVVETFIFRRTMCSFPTNALNKIFATLFSETIKLTNQGNTEFLPVLSYILINKADSSRYPKDSEFLKSFDDKDIYDMNKNARKYLFDRLENQDSREHVNVVDNMQDGNYTIEHIMPQTLSDSWKNTLGSDYKRIYTQWINKLANLTLTAYNSKYSNRSFIEKKHIDNGFDQSGFRLNDFLKNCNQWTEKELLARNDYLKELALKLWPYPETNFQPKQREKVSRTLDEDYDFAGTKIVSYTFKGTPYQVKSWIEMYVNVIEALYEIDPTPLYKVIAMHATKGWKCYLSGTEKNEFTKVADDLYVYGRTNTWNKLNVLNKLFQIYGIDPAELVFEINEKKIRNNN